MCDVLNRLTTEQAVMLAYIWIAAGALGVGMLIVWLYERKNKK